MPWTFSLGKAAASHHCQIRAVSPSRMMAFPSLKCIIMLQPAANLSSTALWRTPHASHKTPGSSIHSSIMARCGVLQGRVAGVCQRNRDIRGLAAGTMYQTAWKHFLSYFSSCYNHRGGCCLVTSPILRINWFCLIFLSNKETKTQGGQMKWPIVISLSARVSG